MSTKEITIAKHVFSIPQPFAAGHVMTEGEAKALNQTFAENIRNNMAKAVETAFGEKPTEELSPETIADYVSKYAESYQFTVGSVGSKRVTDPLEVECRRIARTLLADALKAKGIAMSKVPEEAREAKIAEIAARPQVVTQAKKNIDSRKKMAESVLDGLDLGDASTPDAEAAGEGSTAE